MSEFKIISTKKVIDFEKIKLENFDVLISSEYENMYKVGDTIRLYASTVNVTPVGGYINNRSFQVVGYLDPKALKEMGLKENSIVMNKSIAKRFIKENENVFLWELNDIWKAEKIRKEMSVKFNFENNENDIFTSWEISNKELLSILKTEKLMSFIILLLIIIVASFNLISSLVMTVNNKRGEIAILRTIGCKKSSILAIFMIQGSFMGIVGSILGVLLGIIVSLNIVDIIYFVQKIINIEFLNDFLNTIKITSIIFTSDVLFISLVSLTLSIAVTIYPSLLATQTMPAEVLKNE